MIVVLDDLVLGQLEQARIGAQITANIRRRRQFVLYVLFQRDNQLGIEVQITCDLFTAQMRGARNRRALSDMTTVTGVRARAAADCA